jgi:hypothetical protein
MALPVETQTLPDLGQLRGLSEDTLALCNVRAVGSEHQYGMGWLWDTYTLEGVKATRWKSASSQKPEGDTRWAKYRWLPDKPPQAPFFDPDGKLRAAVKANAGLLIIVGGEVAAMTMFEAGHRCTTCFFGDNTVPKDTLLQDLSRVGATSVLMIPDRDKPGQDCAALVRDLLSADLDIDFTCLALPYPIEDKHGKDVNDWWLDLRAKNASFRQSFIELAQWRLPEPPQKVISFPTIITGDTDLPPRFVDAILRDVTDRIAPKQARWDSEGWSQNFRCPFHDDKEASAGFNKDSMSFKCFACGAKSAKQYGEGVGIYLKDYFDAPVPQVRPPPVAEPATNGKHDEPTVKETLTVPKQVLAPPLPEFARLSPEQVREAERGRDWLNDYVDWAVEASPLTPRLLHEAMGLWLLATISSRRMKAQIGGEDIYSNLYILIVARTTIYRKSTAMKLAKLLLNKANLSALLLPSEATPEALFDELAGVKPMNFDALSEETKARWKLGRALAAQRSFMRDEVSSIFANMKKDYMAGVHELLLLGYDADGGSYDKQLKSKGITTVKDMCFSFLGATTPAMYAKYITIEEQESGLMPRFAIITPDGDVPYSSPSDILETPDALVRQIRRMFNDVLPWHNGQKPSAPAVLGEVLTPPVANVGFDVDGRKQLDLYRRALGHEMVQAEAIDDHLSAFYARIGTMAYKVAMLLAAVDGEPGVIRVECRHAYAAILICESWRESLHRLQRDIDKARGGLSDDNKVLALIKQAGSKGLSMRDIMQLCNLRPRTKAIEALTLLADDGLIEQYQHKPEGSKGGRPTVCYRIVSSSS